MRHNLAEYNVRGQKKDRYSKTDSAWVFADAAGGETLLTFVGMRAVHIENYRSILVYSDTEIKIQCRHYTLVVAGKKLVISYYDKDEMKIAGRLEVIRFE